MDANTKKVFVIDASFILAFLLDEDNTEVEAIFEKFAHGKIDFIAPSLLRYEVGNSLRTMFLRKKLSNEKVKDIYQTFLAMKIREENPDFYEVLGFALSKNLTFYDASYLYLVQRNKSTLLTLDHDLK